MGGSYLIKVLLFSVIFFSSISPITFKQLTGYTKIYLNPAFLILLFSIPIFVKFKAFNEKCFFRSCLTVVILLIFLVLIYFTSSLMTYLFLISRSNIDIDYILPLTEAFKSIFIYILIFPFFIMLKRKYLLFSIKAVLITAFVNFIIFIYGILGMLGIVEIHTELLFILEKIYSQSYTFLGFMPKWAALFYETQVFATFYLISAFFSLILYKVYYKRFYLFSFILFLLFANYLLSKAVILVEVIFLTYLILYKLRFGYLNSLKIFFILSLLSSVLPFIIKKFIKTYFVDVSLIDYALNYDSFGERIFHILKTFDYISDNIYMFLFGIGPRVYGTLVSSEYPQYFNPYTNAISFFSVFQDTGILGFLATLTLIALLYRNIKNNIIRIFFICVFLSYSLQTAWTSSIIIIISLILISRIEEVKNYESLH